MDTRGCASLTPGFMPHLRLGLTCFACHRIHNRDDAVTSTMTIPSNDRDNATKTNTIMRHINHENHR